MRIAANPHYEPTDRCTLHRSAAAISSCSTCGRSSISRAQSITISPGRACAATPSAEMRNVFGIVRDARDRGDSACAEGGDGGRSRFAGSKWTMRRAASSTRPDSAQFFVHRTGHSIGQDVHGNGANMDNLETHDERRVMPWTGFLSSRDLSSGFRRPLRS